jgi:hypothetical protein
LSSSSAAVSRKKWVDDEPNVLASDLTIPVPGLNNSVTSTTTMMPSIRMRTSPTDLRLRSRRTSVLIAGDGDRKWDVRQLQVGSHGLMAGDVDVAAQSGSF